MKSYFGDGDLCSESGAAYMKSILSGATGAEANAAAESAYKAAWDKGARLSPGSACAASETAFKEAYSSGKGSILESARAFVNNWPGLETGNPCAVSGKAYMDAIIDGKSVDDASYLSGKAFIAAFGDLASSGNSIEDPACAGAGFPVLLCLLSTCNQFQMRQRPTLNLPTLRTLQVRNLRRLSSTRR